MDHRNLNNIARFKDELQKHRKERNQQRRLSQRLFRNHLKLNFHDEPSDEDEGGSGLPDANPLKEHPLAHLLDRGGLPPKMRKQPASNPEAVEQQRQLQNRLQHQLQHQHQQQHSHVSKPKPNST